MKDLPHIGTIESVSLTNEGVQAVPAKIDTGADSSAIWASDITEQDGKLSFVLFGRKSPFYTGEVISTKNYRVVSVKNSFGQSERRYKVHIKIVLAGTTIRASFSLANRERNRYPMLIGRRTLRGKFLVDVDRKESKAKLDVLILSTKKTTITSAFAKSLEQHSQKLSITYADYGDLLFVTGGTTNCITLQDSDRDIAGFDLVYFKTTTGFQDIAAATANYLKQRNVPFIDSVFQHFMGTSKLYQYDILTDNDIAVPLSIFMLPARLERSFDFLKEQLELPFILKDVHGQKGEHNFLVTSLVSFKQACKHAAINNVWLIAQAYITNDYDYRVLVFGAKIALVIKRTRRDDSSHLNNTSQGSRATIVATANLPPHIQTASVAAAKLLQRQVAGVDIVQDKVSGLWYCLEVNDVPQLATGSFVTEKQAAFAAYLERKLDK